MNELKPCPFCGGVNIIYNHWHAFYCHGCGVEGPDADNRDEVEALAAWNARAIAAEVLANPPAGAVGDKGAAWKEWRQHPIFAAAGGSADPHALTHFDAGWMRAKEAYATPPAADAPPSASVNPDRDLHSHMMVLATRTAAGRASKEVLRDVCKAIAADKNLRAKLAPAIPSASDTASGAVGRPK